MNVLLTGASRGLGLEIATQLLLAGHNVYALSRTRSTAMQDLESQYPGKLQWFESDFSQLGDDANQFLQERLPNEVILDGFVNNAASAYDDLITNLDSSRLEAMFRTNVFSPMQLTKQVIRRMLLHGTAGSIVHVSSISVHTGYKGLSMYAATKGAIEAFSKNVAREWGSLQIRSNCVVAGFMETSMSATLSDEQRQKIYSRTALKSATSAASVASTIAYLLSPASSSITGQNIFVDSGTI